MDFLPEVVQREYVYRVENWSGTPVLFRLIFVMAKKMQFDNHLRHTKKSALLPLRASSTPLLYLSIEAHTEI